MPHPLVYEINTRCWLYDLSETHATQITLANVPETEFAGWRQLGFTHIWLMGVWTTGPRSREVTRQVSSLLEIYSPLLPDFSDDDLIGSPYAIAGYTVSELLGGESGLQEFRRKLNTAGLKLILDFIPNHLGLDHPWLEKLPDLFVQSSQKTSGTFAQNTVLGPRWIAHGKDPYFDPWTDTAQLDYRNPATWEAMIEELRSVARHCDGVRCDMAMLLLTDVFNRNWAHFPERELRSASALPTPKTPEQPPGDSEKNQPIPKAEFWAKAIATVKTAQPDFLFLAEAYWNLEPRLIELGFDFAYDKLLTDHLLAHRYAALREGLFGKSVKTGAHFLENHDEPRIASVLSFDEHRAAALLMLGLPGLRLLHEGQLAGATIRASVHLRRRPREAPQQDIARFYELFLATLQKTAVGQGRGEVLHTTAAWNGNPTAENLMVVQWQLIPRQFDLVVINFAPHPSQCYVQPVIDGLAERNWEMINLLGSERFKKSGAALQQTGLYLDLSSHGAQLFHFQ